MYCKKCGHPNEENSVYCKGCGFPLRTKIKTALSEEQLDGAIGATESLIGPPVSGYAGPSAPLQIFEQPSSLNNAPQLKMKSDKKKSKLPVIIIIALILVIGAASAAIFGVSALNTKKYDELIDTGNKYLEELKYEEAVETYLEAIDVKPKRQEAYVGAATGYVKLDKPEKAKDILEKGLENVKEPGKELTNLCDALGVTYNDDVTAAENDLSADNLVFNNGGLYVKYKGNVYYREYTAASIASRAEFGNYGYVSNIGKNMVCLHKDGTKEVLFEDLGAGNIYICENRMILQKDSEIYSVSLDGSNYRSYGKGYVFAIDEKLKLMICSSSEYGLKLFAILIDSGEISMLTEGGRFIAFDNGVIYFSGVVDDQNLAQMGKVILCSIKSDGSGKKVLAETEPDLYNSPIDSDARIPFLQIVNDYIYFFYGCYGGYPCYFQGGNISRVKKDGRGYEILVERKSFDEYEEVGSKFYVAKTSSGENLYYNSRGDHYLSDKTITASFESANGKEYVMDLENKSVLVTSVSPAPLETPFLENREVFVYLDNSGKKTKLIAASDYANSGMLGELSDQSAYSHNEFLFDINGIEVVDGWVYYKMEYGKFNEEATAGRMIPLYDRILSKVYQKNLVTGAIEMLYSY